MVDFFSGSSCLTGLLWNLHSVKFSPQKVFPKFSASIAVLLLQMERVSLLRALLSSPVPLSCFNILITLSINL